MTCTMSTMLFVYSYSEEPFKEFIKSLPALLLKSYIYDSTIQMLNRVVLQHRQWIQKELEQNHDAIIGEKYIPHFRKT